MSSTSSTAVGRARAPWLLVTPMIVALAACGRDSRGGGGGGADGGGGGGACLLSTTCPAGTLAGEIRGDMGADVVEHAGTEPAWVHVDVLEADSQVYPAPMHVTAALTSPPGAKFELRVYADTATYGTDGGPIEPDAGLLLACAELAAEADGTGRLELSWGETDPDAWANGREDGRRLAFEIRHISGACPTGTTWRLRVEGN